MFGSTGIKGLDIILGRSKFPPDEADSGFRLLIRGVPGTGKTTLGLHMLHHQLVNKNNSPEKEITNTGLIIYLQETIESLNRLSALFQLDFKPNPPATARVAFDEYRKNFPFIKSWINGQITRYGHEIKMCIFIDGLSLAKSSITEPYMMHDFILRLLTELPRRNLFLIIANEDEILAKDNFFQHMVDGVFDLSISDNSQRHRFIEIKKCRYIDFFKGKHGFELFQRPKTRESLLQVYPNPACHFLIAKTEAEQYLSQKSFPEPVPTNIIGLERIVRGLSSNNFLRYGDVFVVCAEPGTDKIGMGLSFLSAPSLLNQSQAESFSNYRCAWLSFGCSSIDRSLCLEAYKSRFKTIANSYCKFDTIDMPEADMNFIEIDRPSIAMHPDRVLFQFSQIISVNNQKPIRVIVDGLNNIGREFEDAKKMVEYTIMIIRILRYYQTAAIVFIDLPRCSQPIGNISMEWAEEADFVGHLRRSKIDGKFVETFMITKSRYFGFSSDFYKVGIDKQTGLTTLMNMEAEHRVSS
jgi:KaiC/GvpD/RAD55 family RecA-like ATPase